MRARDIRLLPALDRDPAGRLAAEGAPPEKPAELTWWDWTVFLLHTAAEIEHALMVQYLYAAYSLASGGPPGPGAPPDAAVSVGRWQQTILGIAREEMAHLLTVQNLLRFAGGPLNLEREDFPFRAPLYPFPLLLEPLSRTSLAKYVAAEMPADPPQPELIREIVERATGATGGLAVNRVGVLYDALAEIFADQTRLADSDLRPDTADTLQARPDEWLAFSGLIVRAVRTRAEAVAALRAIGEQGEGSQNTSPLAAPSHFDRFLQIYTSFPEDAAWHPAWPVPVGPNTMPVPSTDPAAEAGRITHPVALLWAHLFNVRYRMLLVDLAHVLSLPGPLLDNGVPTLRGHLRDWALQEMRGRSKGGLKGIAKKLTGLPLKEEDGPARAAPPFELPYTLALPDRERDRWRLHLALLDVSAELIARIGKAEGPQDLLTELAAIDGAARPVVTAQLGPG
jgi:hypothetical protein